MTDKFGGNKAAAALYLLGLIERHGWDINHAGDGSVAVSPSKLWPDLHEHEAPTLIEALTEAANCNGCCGRTE